MIRIEYWTRWNNEIRRIMHVAPPICDILGVYYNKGRIPPKYTKMQKKGSKNGGMSKIAISVPKHHRKTTFVRFCHKPDNRSG